MRQMFAAAVVAVASVSAAEAREISALDFLVDAAELVGQRVTVRDCTLGAAGDTVIFCDVLQSGRSIGVVVISSKTMRRDDLRTALRHCAALRGDDKCRASAIDGDVRRTGGGQVFVDRAQITWASRPQ